MSVAVREPSMLAATGVATMASDFWSFTMVVSSHSSHVKKRVEASEKQKEIEDF